MIDWSAEELEELSGRITASPHVADLSEGPSGVVAAYLPGRRVPGLRILPDGRLEVHVVMAWGSTADQVEASVVEAFERPEVLAGLYIDDIVLPGQDAGAIGTTSGRPVAAASSSPRGAAR
ncbi:MAG: hypothetical protein ACLFXM_05840 [Acidimicrobiia bacterium]